MKRTTVLSLCALILFSLAQTGCKGGNNKNDPILALSAEEALNEGKTLFAEEKYYRARRYLSHAYEVEPNSTGGREALLMVADSYFEQGGEANFIQAEAKYRDFLNRFPTSERAAYVQFQLGNSLAKRIERADRDQSPTRRALAAYQEVMRLYPTSEYAAQARSQIGVVREKLAEHEFSIGSFYQKFRLPLAAIQRYEYLLENFPDYRTDEVLFELTQVYREANRAEDALKALLRLNEEFPDSPYTAELKGKLAEAHEQAQAAAAAREAREEAEKNQNEADGDNDS